MIIFMAFFICIFRGMKIVSLNIGKLKPVAWKDEIITTGIFKSPTTNPCKVSFLNIEGDEQADLRVHGGIDKAIYAYDISHYQHWKNVLQRTDWNYGLFGENLTTKGLHDDEVRVGNVYQIGSCQLMAVQPRFPCIKINIRFALNDMIEKFMQQKRNGIYFKVIKEGIIQVNDNIELIKTSPHNVTIQDFVESYYSKGKDEVLLQKIIAIEFLPERMRKAFESFL